MKREVESAQRSNEELSSTKREVERDLQDAKKQIEAQELVSMAIILNPPLPPHISSWRTVIAIVYGQQRECSMHNHAHKQCLCWETHTHTHTFLPRMWISFRRV